LCNLEKGLSTSTISRSIFAALTRLKYDGEANSREVRLWESREKYCVARRLRDVSFALVAKGVGTGSAIVQPP
jgi:hypothetical protein